MKFSFTKTLPKITAACSTDKNYPTLQHVHLNVELGELQATNSYLAVRIPVKPERGDASGPLSPDAVEAAIKGKVASLKANKRAQPKHTAELGYPAFGGFWPSLEDVEASSFRVGLNLALVRSIIGALGANGVELVFPAYNGDGPNPQRPILIRPIGHGYTPRENGPTGSVSLPEAVLMPIKLAEVIPNE
jgi:hypothetical protein